MNHKSFPLNIKSVDDESGIIKFYGSTFGNIDRAGDIVLPGAFKDTLPEFLESGIIAWQHNWDEPIGKPLEAHEDEKGLYIKAQLILSIPKARECYELMKAGVIKKFSIGYNILEADPLTIENLPNYMSDEGAIHEIANALSWGYALQKLELFEVSPVSIPANPKCDLTNIKSGLRAGLRFDEYSELVHATNTEFVKHAKEIRDLRAKEGRPLSAATRTRLADACSSMETACADIKALLDETDPQKGLKRARSIRIEAEALELEAELLGCR